MTTKFTPRRSFLAICLALFASVRSGAVARSAAETQDVEAAAQLALRWSRIARDKFEAARARTSEVSGKMLDEFIVKGAARAARENADSERLRSADQGIGKFADAMIAAGSHNADGTLRLGEESFVAARSKVCPLYPFC